MQVKAWVDTPADSLTLVQSLDDDVTASIRSERHTQNNNKTTDWYKVVLIPAAILTKKKRQDA